MTGRPTKKTEKSLVRTRRLSVLPVPTVAAATERILFTDRRSLTQGTMITRTPPPSPLIRRRRERMTRTNLSVNMASTATVKILSTEKTTNTPDTLSLNELLK